MSGRRREPFPLPHSPFPTQPTFGSSAAAHGAAAHGACAADTTKVWNFINVTSPTPQPTPPDHSNRALPPIPADPARQQPQHFREAEIGPKWISLPQWFKMHDYVTLASGKLYHPAHPPNDDFPTSWTTDEEINPCAWPVMRSEHAELARPEKWCSDPLATVSWPWVPACGSLEPPRRDGENAQKTGENGAKMGEIRPNS